MAIRFTCDGCGQKYAVPERLAGRKATCKKCGRSLGVPGAAADKPSGGGLDLGVLAEIEASGTSVPQESGPVAATPLAPDISAPAKPRRRPRRKLRVYLRWPIVGGVLAIVGAVVLGIVLGPQLLRDLGLLTGPMPSIAGAELKVVLDGFPGGRKDRHDTERDIRAALIDRLRGRVRALLDEGNPVRLAASVKIVGTVSEVLSVSEAGSSDERDVRVNLHELRASLEIHSAPGELLARGERPVETSLILTVATRNESVEQAANVNVWWSARSAFRNMVLQTPDGKAFQP